MCKKDVIAKLLSGVFAATVAFSGVSTVASLDADAAFGIDYQLLSKLDSAMGGLGDIEAIMDENSEIAYKVNMNMKTSDDEIKLKPVDVSALIKQKDRKTAADINVKYDSENAVTLNTVYDYDTDTTYLRIPELNDAYLSAKGEEAFMFLNLIDMFSAPDDYYDDYYDEDEDYNEDDSDDEDYEDDYVTYPDFDIENIIKNIDNIDFELLEKDINEYLDIIETKLTGADGENVSVKMGERDFTLATKVYNITGQDFQNAVNAVADKLRNDSLLKDLFVQLGGEEENYSKMIDEIITEVNDMRPSELTEKFVVTVYMNDGTIVGVGTADDESESRDIIIADDTFIGVDSYVKDDYSTEITNGAVTVEDNKINGSFEDKMVFDDDTYYSEKTTFDNVVIGNDVLSGKIIIDTEDNSYDDGEVYKSSSVITFDCNSDKLNLLYVTTEDGKEVMSLTLTGEKVEITDIEIPTEKVYSIGNQEDFAAYVESADFEGFMTNLKNVLGDELFEELFGEFEIAEPETGDNSDTDDSKADVIVTTKTETSKNTNSKSDSSKNTNQDKSPDTGVTAGISFAVVALAGMALVVSKKK